MIVTKLEAGQKLPKRKARERTEAELRAIVEELGKWVTQNHDTFKVSVSADAAESSENLS